MWVHMRVYLNWFMRILYRGLYIFLSKNLDFRVLQFPSMVLYSFLETYREEVSAMLTATNANIHIDPTLCTILQKLGYPTHRLGYSYLLIATARYAQGDMVSLSKELYPYVAKLFGYRDWPPVENAIRSATEVAWETAPAQVWKTLFPCCQKAPTNKQLIATLAEILQQNTPPEHERG